jgi:hypothetical protein
MIEIRDKHRIRDAATFLAGAGLAR